jgi:hypothetical protein
MSASSMGIVSGTASESSNDSMSGSRYFEMALSGRRIETSPLAASRTFLKLI